MLLARVAGTVVATEKEKRLEGLKLLLLEKIDAEKMNGKQDYLVALDAVGAGENEIVFYVGGSSSRQTETTEGKPTDATVIGIVDILDIDGKIIYQKDKS